MNRYLKLSALVVIALFAVSCGNEMAMDDDVLLDDPIVEGHVYLSGSFTPAPYAQVYLYYREEGSMTWYSAGSSIYTTANSSGYYSATYISDSYGKPGKVYAVYAYGGRIYSGTTYFTYPSGTTTTQDVYVN